MDRVTHLVEKELCIVLAKDFIKCFADLVLVSGEACATAEK